MAKRKWDHQNYDNVQTLDDYVRAFNCVRRHPLTPPEKAVEIEWDNIRNTAIAAEDLEDYYAGMDMSLKTRAKQGGGLSHIFDGGDVEKRSKGKAFHAMGVTGLYNFEAGGGHTFDSGIFREGQKTPVIIRDSYGSMNKFLAGSAYKFFVPDGQGGTLTIDLVTMQPRLKDQNKCLTDIPHVENGLSRGWPARIAGLGTWLAFGSGMRELPNVKALALAPDENGAADHSAILLPDRIVIEGLGEMHYGTAHVKTLTDSIRAAIAADFKPGTIKAQANLCARRGGRNINAPMVGDFILASEGVVVSEYADKVMDFKRDAAPLKPSWG